MYNLLEFTTARDNANYGRYGSKRMKDWLEIVQLYEKDHVYLGESARILQHNVEYDDPPPVCIR